MAYPEDRLLLVLYELRFNEPWTRMAATFDMSRSYIQETVMGIVKSITPVLVDAFVKSISHQQQQDLGLHSDSFPDCCFIVDCTNQTINRPGTLLKQSHSTL